MVLIEVRVAKAGIEGQIGEPVMQRCIELVDLPTFPTFNPVVVWHAKYRYKGHSQAHFGLHESKWKRPALWR